MTVNINDMRSVKRPAQYLPMVCASWREVLLILLINLPLHILAGVPHGPMEKCSLPERPRIPKSHRQLVAKCLILLRLGF